MKILRNVACKAAVVYGRWLFFLSSEQKLRSSTLHIIFFGIRQEEHLKVKVQLLQEWIVADTL